MRRTVCDILLSLILLLSSGINCRAQNPYGTTGLLRMPTAEMQESGTFMMGATYLPKKGTQPNRPSYDTFNYFFNLTLFPWMEVSYTLTMNQGTPGNYWPEQTWGRFVNQDRSFHVKFMAIEEGSWKWWTPQIAIGANDPLTHSHAGGGEISFENGAEDTNNYLTRFYIAAAKHFNFGQYGELGVHAAWVWGRAKDVRTHYSRPAFGAQYRFTYGDGQWWAKALNGLSLMAEYDARTVNVGCWYDFPDIYRKQNSGASSMSFHAYCELNQCKYPTAGVLIKVHLL